MGGSRNVVIRFGCVVTDSYAETGFRRAAASKRFGEDTIKGPRWFPRDAKAALILLKGTFFFARPPPDRSCEREIKDPAALGAGRAERSGAIPSGNKWHFRGLPAMAGKWEIVTLRRLVIQSLTCLAASSRCREHGTGMDISLVLLESQPPLQPFHA